MSAVTPPPALRPADILERVARQLLQTYGPAIAVVLTSIVTGHSTAWAAATALVTILIGTTIKAASKLRSKPGDPLWLVLIDRAGSALGFELAGLGVTDWFGLIHLDWNKALTAAAAAAGLAAIMYFFTPPSNPPTPTEPNADGSYTITDVDRGDADRAIYGDTDAPYRPGATDGKR